MEFTTKTILVQHRLQLDEITPPEVLYLFARSRRMTTYFGEINPSQMFKELYNRMLPKAYLKDKSVTHMGCVVRFPVLSSRCSYLSSSESEQSLCSRDVHREYALVADLSVTKQPSSPGFSSAVCSSWVEGARCSNPIRTRVIQCDAGK